MVKIRMWKCCGQSNLSQIGYQTQRQILMRTFSQDHTRINKINGLTSQVIKILWQRVIFDDLQNFGDVPKCIFCACPGNLFPKDENKRNPTCIFLTKIIFITS